MNSPEIVKFIHKHSSLFWYIKDKESLSIDAIVEATLNYGNRESIKELFDLFGLEKVSQIFNQQLSRERNNYFPPVKNFFTLYFNRHVQTNTK
jgi:hypothetical protein